MQKYFELSARVFIFLTKVFCFFKITHFRLFLFQKHIFLCKKVYKWWYHELTLRRMVVWGLAFWGFTLGTRSTRPGGLLLHKYYIRDFCWNFLHSYQLSTYRHFIVKYITVIISKRVKSCNDLFCPFQSKRPGSLTNLNV